MENEKPIEKFLSTEIRPVRRESRFDAIEKSTINMIDNIMFTNIHYVKIHSKPKSKISGGEK
ncbi:hypothetical protein [Bacillus multifaciens]|uniref:hypothetical protein n=1 Tax=Bacillus multifaciens TaxID=3068506 RepID=UPI0027416F30|nr:hypothetical protein [Bacillus sp. WLY-B-L8]MDP7978547.1 hypothetical protein [Bacillus sp. WLY-B-L8]